MPTVNCGFENRPRQLSGRGATLYVEIGYDANFRPGDETRPDLSLAQYEALIDTGAAATCVDEELATRLRLPEPGQEEVAAALGSGKTNVYAAQIYVHGLEYTFTAVFLACVWLLAVSHTPSSSAATSCAISA